MGVVGEDDRLLLFGLVADSSREFRLGGGGGGGIEVVVVEGVHGAQLTGGIVVVESITEKRREEGFSVVVVEVELLFRLYSFA